MDRSVPREYLFDMAVTPSRRRFVGRAPAGAGYRSQARLVVEPVEKLAVQSSRLRDQIGDRGAVPLHRLQGFLDVAPELIHHLPGLRMQAFDPPAALLRRLGHVSAKLIEVFRRDHAGDVLALLRALKPLLEAFERSLEGAVERGRQSLRALLA